MLVVALIAAWCLLAGIFALVIGRALAVSGKSDRWRHGHRETRDLRKLHPVPLMVPRQATSDEGRTAA